MFLVLTSIRVPPLKSIPKFKPLTVSKQIEIMTKDRKLFMFPRLWWGWLGQNQTMKNKTEQGYRNREQNRLRNKQTKRFKKLIRKLQRWILRN